MKRNKLFLTSMLGLALVATSACNLNFFGPSKSKKKKSSSTDITDVSGSGDISGDTSGDISGDTSGDPGERYPVRVVVNSPANAVVGEALDLDEIVTVHYSDESTDKVYEVTPLPASVDLVSVQGHVVTFLAEGVVNLSIIAGERTAKFTTSALSRIKKEFADAVTPISTNFALYDLEFDDQGNGSVSPWSMKDEDYTAFKQWDEDDGGNILPGGFLKTKRTGTTFAYDLDTSWANIDVIPQPYGTYSNYFVNMPLSINPSDFTTMEGTDDQGNTYEYLHMDASVPSPSYSQYFASYIDEFCYCNMAFQLNSSYKFGSMDIYKEQFDENRERFLFSINVLTSAGADAGSFLEFLMYSTDAEYGVEAVRTYIDGGNEPISQDFSLLKQRFADIASAKNYTVSITSSEVYYEDENFTTPSETQYSYTETVLANDTQYEDSAVLTTKDSTSKNADGLVEHSGSLYSYQYDATNDNYPATLVGAGKTVYSDGLSSTLSSLAAETYWTEFFVSYVETEAGVTTYTLATSLSEPFLLGFLSLTYSGSAIKNMIDYYKTNSEVDFLGDSYSECTIALSANETIIHLVTQVRFSDANVQWDLTATFDQVGSTPAIGTTIVYPA